jgi:hypothetical protein
MIIEKHNYALIDKGNNQVELIEDVVYESMTDMPFQGIGFQTYPEVEEYMQKNGLQLYEPESDML